jgi:class 3 adenylate cyclase
VEAPRGRPEPLSNLLDYSIEVRAGRSPVRGGRQGGPVLSPRALFRVGFAWARGSLPPTDTSRDACSTVDSLGLHGCLTRPAQRGPDGCSPSYTRLMTQTRKVVTVVFMDVSGSTALGEQLDSEAVRHVMERYFGAARLVLERHGGTVEKFIGDAVMAAFGIPAAHEDDPLRAVRAAIEMRERLTELNEEFLRRFGVTLAVRTGINTGEVVAGDRTEGQFSASG